jgi:hypothetical protein
MSLSLPVQEPLGGCTVLCSQRFLFLGLVILAPKDRAP